MIKATVMYPNGQGARFDMQYYLGQHIPLVQRLLGSRLKGVAVDQGLGGGAPGEPAPYLAVCHLTFESMESFQGIDPGHMQQFMSDVPNYTNTQPVIQVSEVKL